MSYIPRYFPMLDYKLTLYVYLFASCSSPAVVLACVGLNDKLIGMEVGHKYKHDHFLNAGGMPFFNPALRLIGAIGFWPLQVYMFPMRMHLVRLKIGQGDS